MGRPQFATPGTGANTGEKVAGVDRPDILKKDLTQTGSVASGNTENTDLTAPGGSIYILRNLLIIVNSDSDATSGTHYMQVRMLNTSVEAIKGESNYNTNLTFNNSVWASADVTQRPGTASGQVQAIQSLTATDSKPITFKYTNNTDAAMENDRQIVAIVEERNA